MISLNTAIFFIFGILIIGYLAYAFFIVYHLRKFGIGILPWFLSIIFTLGSILFLTLLSVNFRQTDWGSINLDNLYNLYKF